MGDSSLTLILLHSPSLIDYATILTSFTFYREHYVFTEINEAVFSWHDSSLTFQRAKKSAIHNKINDSIK